MDLNLPTSGPQWQGQAQTAKMLELQRQYQNPENQDQKKLKKAAQEFEAIFVQQMLDAMDKTIDRKDSFLNGGSSEEYFRSMLNEEIAKSMTSKQGGSGFGLAESIYRQMTQNSKKSESGTSGAMGAPTMMVQGTNGEVK